MGHSRLLRIAQWSCLPLIVLALSLPYAQFLPILWVAAAFTMLTLAFLITRIILTTKSVVAMLYGFAFGISAFANFAEIIAAATGFRGLIGVANSVTAALLSSLVIALAIAEHLRQERAAKIQAKEQLKHTYEAVPVGLFTVDEHGMLTQANPALKSMLGIDLSDRLSDCYMSHYFDLQSWKSLLLAARNQYAGELVIPFAPENSDSLKWFQVKATVSKGKIEGSLQDVTDRHIATERLRFLAEHDPLTGVLNRRGIEHAMADASAELGEGQSMGVAYLDLDRFKLINDLYGHVVGDEVLRQVCQRVKEVLGSHVVGRIGGDEFIILLRVGPMQAATEICERVIQALETWPYQIAGKAFHVRASIGLVEVPGNTEVKDAISTADRACREAKKGLRGHLLTYEKSSAVFRERESELRMMERFGGEAVPEGLFLEMQPIMSLTEPYGSLNFEALIRMREPDGTVISAGEIISAVENNGNTAIIDRWVLNTMLTWLDKHLPRLTKTRFVCINLSGASLNDERFIHDAFTIMAAHPLSVKYLCFEITESVALRDLDTTRRFIDGAKSFGARIALDDFGAGYTSFSYLRKLPADTVKIDGSFVRDVCKHPANLSIVAAIADLARNLGMKTIAEWAEDQHTLDALAEVGVDYVQGWVIAKGQSPEKILAADSAADLIEDEKIAVFVRHNLPIQPEDMSYQMYPLH